MTIKHTFQTALANDAAKDVSANRWNADHTIGLSIQLPPQSAAPGGAVAGELWYDSVLGAFVGKDIGGNRAFQPS